MIPFQVREYVQLISVYEKKLSNLTVRVEIMEKDTISYTELDFELIKIEVKEMEKLITQLKGSVVGSTAVVNQLEVEVRREPLSESFNNKFSSVGRCQGQATALSSNFQFCTFA